jgi:DNA-binding MarR family transcriptional regulator
MRIEAGMECRNRDKLIEDLMRNAFKLTWAVNRGMVQYFRGRNQITFTRFMVLRLLEEAEPRSVSSVAEFLGVSNADVSSIVDRLVSQKLLLRVECPSDRRIRELSLTSSARQLLSDYERSRKGRLAELFRTCSSEDLCDASKILRRVSTSVANQRSGLNNAMRTGLSAAGLATPGLTRGGL